MDKKNLSTLFDVARTDPIYAQMVERYQVLEMEVGRITQQLGKRDEDRVWEFICLSDHMNLKMIEILCKRFGLVVLDSEEGQ